MGIHLLVILGDTIISIKMIPRLYTDFTLNSCVAVFSTSELKAKGPVLRGACTLDGEGTASFVCSAKLGPEELHSPGTASASGPH